VGGGGGGRSSGGPPPPPPPAFPVTPAGVSAASLAKFVAARPSTTTLVDAQCGWHAPAAGALLGRLATLRADWVTALEAADGAAAPLDAAAADVAAAVGALPPARLYVCVTANKAEERRARAQMADAAGVAASAGAAAGGGGVAVTYRLAWQLDAGGKVDVGEGAGGAGVHQRNGRLVALVARRGLGDRAFGEVYRQTRGGGRVRWLLTERGGKAGGLQAFQLF